MAIEKKKIIRPILMIRDIIKKLALDFGQDANKLRFPRQALMRFVHFVENVTDVRLEGMISYPLPYILLIAFLAVLSGADGWSEIESFGKRQKRLLERWLPKYDGIPSHDTFRRVFGLIDPELLGKAITSFLIQELGSIKKALGIEDNGYRLINADGKEANGTGRKYGSDEKVSNLQTLNIYDASNGVILGSIPIDEKTNEIPTLQSYLEPMHLEGCIVTFDALNTQKETVSVIHERGGDYVGGLKGNHQLFFDDVKLYFDNATLAQIRKDKTNFRSYTEKAHNRIETRDYYLSTDIAWFADLVKWAGLKSNICYDIKTEDLVTGKKTFERRYYISSLTDIEVVADAIRGHWGVENSLHWHLDVTFSEDDNTTMDKNAFNNLSILNKLALTLCKLIQPIMKVGLRIVRKNFGWDLEGQLTVLLSLFDEDVLMDAMNNLKK